MIGDRLRPWATAATVALVLAGLSPPPTAAADSARGVTRSILVGGGPLPDSNHVSFEQDLMVAAEVFPDPVLLFAGGASSPSVQELRSDPPDDALRAELAELFDPRPFRHSAYRRPRLDAEPATREAVEAAVLRALAQPGEEALNLFITAHGEPGPDPADGAVLLWGSDPYTVADLADLHDRADTHRGLRLVVASCYSGSFAELLFTAADPSRGPAEPLRCGLFAATWDAESSGCDSNPERSQQESYGLHFLNALVGRDRHRAPVPPALIDADGDGAISLLEAHTWARRAGASIDVPTTTSEWYLRTAVPANATRTRPVELPEDELLIRHLGRDLGLADEEAAEARLVELDAELAELDRRLVEVEDASTVAHLEVVTRLTERWPLLADPWHPGFAAQLEANREAIAAVVRRSEPARRAASLEARIRSLGDRWSELEATYARTLRLQRAYETRRLAGHLRALGGESWGHYQALLACERAVLSPDAAETAAPQP